MLLGLFIFVANFFDSDICYLYLPYIVYCIVVLAKNIIQILAQSNFIFARYMYMLTFGPLHLRSSVTQLILVEHHSNFIKALLRSYTYIYIRFVIL